MIFDACRPRAALLAFALLAFSPAALPAAEPGDVAAGARAFASLDRDGDGAISAAEYGAARDAEFRQLDADRNGGIERAEYVDRRVPQSDLGSARAEDLRRQLSARFAALDTDADGRISAAEYAAYGRLQFGRLDRDGDGRVVRAEFLGLAAPGAPRADPGARVFAVLDRNGDGAVTLEEMDAARRAAFDRLDANRDGAIDPGEFALRHPPDGPLLPPELQRRQEDPRFTALDANRDRRLSLEEYLADGRARFARADRNGDGRVTLDEFDAAGP